MTPHRDRHSKQERGTFIIDAAGTIRYVVVNPRGQAREFSEYRDVLAGLEQA